MAIRHVVFWKLSPTTPAGRDEQVAAIRSALTALIGRVEGLHTLDVHPTIDSDQAWDLVLDAVFSDASALAAYLVHPLHEAAGRSLPGTVVDRVAADYDDGLPAGSTG